MMNQNQYSLAQNQKNTGFKTSYKSSFSKQNEHKPPQTATQEVKIRKKRSLRHLLIPPGEEGKQPSIV